MSAKRFFGASIAAMVVAAVPGAAYAQQTYSFDVPAEKLADSLRAIGARTGTSIAFDPALTRGKKAPAIKGVMGVNQALSTALSGSGLEARTSASGYIVAAHAADLGNAVAGGPNAGNKNPTSSLGEAAATAENESAQTQAIVVTGTHIRGAAPVGSPLITISKADIDKSGYSTAQQLLQSLPQNFVGGASEQGAAQDSTYNGPANLFSKGAGINLRGLGNDSTLVLVDGRRLAPSGIGDFVDISMLPLGAIQRIDVLTDGASAIYGADAVAGVVNFVLRDDYDGAESRIRYGTVTEGSNSEFEASQLAGTHWATGHILVNFDYYDRTRLDASDRDFVSPALTANGTVPSDLIPAQKRFSVFSKITQDLSNRVSLFSDVYYSRRHTTVVNYNPFSFFGPQRQTFDDFATLYGGTTGADIELPSGWNGEVSGTYSYSHNRRPSTVNGLPNPEVITTSRDLALDASANGPLFHINGNPAKLAVGAQYRRERLSADIPPAVKHLSRSVDAVYAELNVPVIAADDGVAWTRELSVSAAVRHEHYSDFGGTTNPKFGVSWEPVRGVGFRASWGTSFRAPVLFDTDTSRVNGIMLSLADPARGGAPSNMLFVYNGPVPDIGPERAKTVTAGIDLTPPRLRGFKAGATYFRIDFKDRIGAISNGSLGYSGVFTPSFYGDLISRPADPAIVALAESIPTGFFFNLTNVPPSASDVSIDNRLRNLAITRLSGLDFLASYELATAGGHLSFGLNGTKYFSYENQATKNAPLVSILNTVYHQPSIRARGSAAWLSGPFNLALFVNYTGSYTNNLTTPFSHVSSWTTLDLTASYAVPVRSGFLSGFTLTLSAINLLNRDPPRIIDVDGSYGDVGYDSQNANPLGRFVSFQIVKRW